MKKILCLLLAAILALSFVACTSETKDNESSNEETSEETSEESIEATAIPDVKGKTEADALAALKAAGYTNVKTVACYKEGSTKGNVVAQSLTPGAIFSGDKQIVISISNGLSVKDSAASEIEDPLLADREKLEVGANSDYQVLNYDHMNAIWLSQLDLIPVYYDEEAKLQRTEDDFTAKINTIMKNIADSGFNTVMVQVHPDCDSMYVSENFPWSDYLNGNSNRDANGNLITETAEDITAKTYGNTSLYDLMPIMIEAAHANKLSFHAWINPMRGFTIEEMDYVNNAYTIKQWYNDADKKESYLFHTSSRYYLNPAYEEVRSYIASVASEICRYYDVDGVHIDDYFYPSASAEYDAEEFAAQTEFPTLNAYRKNNINLLVKALYDAVKAENKDMLFGISPAGNIENNMNTLAADVQTWCSVDGYTDYICPQIYFGFKHSTVAFDKLSQRWIDMTTAENVKVVLGVTLHKAGKVDTYAGAGKNEWVEDPELTKKSYEWIQANTDKVDGVCLFSYQYLFDAVTGERTEYTKSFTDAALPVIKAMKW